MTMLQQRGIVYVDRQISRCMGDGCMISQKKYVCWDQQMDRQVDSKINREAGDEERDDS